MKSLPILDARATGIDVGSERVYVSVGGGEPRVFGTMTRDIHEAVRYLREQGVGSVAMEATGVYWMCLYAALTAAGMRVVVVNGRQVRNLPGRKTDMADCQWIATLHAHNQRTPLLRHPPVAGLHAAAGGPRGHGGKPRSAHAEGPGAHEREVP